MKYKFFLGIFVLFLLSSAFSQEEEVKKIFIAPGVLAPQKFVNPETKLEPLKQHGRLQYGIVIREGQPVFCDSKAEKLMDQELSFLDIYYFADMAEIFTLDARYIQDLDKGNLSYAIKSVFDSNGYQLSGKPSPVTEEASLSWHIQDGENHYYIAKKQNFLQVYDWNIILLCTTSEPDWYGDRSIREIVGWTNRMDLFEGSVSMRFGEFLEREQEEGKKLSREKKKDIENLYVRVVSAPEKQYKAYTQPSRDPKYLQGKYNKAVLPHQFYYVYGIAKEGSETFYLLGRSDSINIDQIDKAKELMIGWMPKDYLEIWLSNVGLEMDKMTKKDTKETWYQWRKRSSRPIMVYKSRKDLEDSLLMGKTSNAVAIENLGEEQPWEYDRMRFMIQNKHNNILGNKTAYQISFLSQHGGGKSPEDVRRELAEVVDQLRRLDIVLVVDTSTSMLECIPLVKELMIKIARQIEEAIDPHKTSYQGAIFSDYISLQLGVCCYRDYDQPNNPESYLVQLSNPFDLSNEAGMADFESYMGKIKGQPGETIHEAPYEGIVAAYRNRKFWRPGSAKIMVVFGAAGHHPQGQPKKNNFLPAHPNQWSSPLHVLQALQAKDGHRVQLYGVHMPDGKKKEFDDFAEQIGYLCENTQGKFFRYNEGGGELLTQAMMEIVSEQQKRVRQEIEALLKNIDTFAGTDPSRKELFTLSAEQKKFLEKEDIAELVKLFRGNRVLLSEETILMRADDGWLVEDIGGQKKYNILPSDNQLKVYERVQDPSLISVRHRLDEIFSSQPERLQEISKAANKVYYDRGWVWEQDPENAHRYFFPTILVTQKEFNYFIVFLQKLQDSFQKIKEELRKGGKVNPPVEKCRHLMLRMVLTHFDRGEEFDQYKDKIKSIQELSSLISVIPLKNSVYYQDIEKYFREKGPKGLQELSEQLDEKLNKLLALHQNKDPYSHKPKPFYFRDSVTGQSYGWLPQHELP